MNGFTIILSCLLFGACASSRYTPAEQAYVDKVEKTPLAFRTSKDSAAVYKAKTQIWLGKYSDLPIRSVTGNTIQTEPATEARKWSYSITFNPVSDSMEVTVDWTNKWNARLLSYYLQTGEFMRSVLITK